jgi:hypothetical protein
MLGYTEIDLGAHVGAFVPGIVTQLKATTEDQVDNALKLLSSLCGTINNADNVILIVDAIGEAGSKMPPNPLSREGLVRGLQVISSSISFLGSSGISRVMDSAVNALLTMIEKEKTPKPRKVALLCLGTSLYIYIYIRY